MKNFTKYSALTTTTLLIVALAGPANAANHKPHQEPTVETVSQPVLAPIEASPSASVAFEKPAIKTVAYVPPTPEPTVAVESAVVAPAAPVAAPTTQTKAPAAPVAPKATPAASAPAVAPAAPVAASGKAAGLVASAYSQIGITQDCTAMVEHALASVGIISGDLAPAQFFRFGPVVSTPAPGDILISSGHVGIYVGNGQMISGGFNGSQTVLHPVSYVGAFSAVRVA